MSTKIWSTRLAKSNRSRRRDETSFFDAEPLRHEHSTQVGAPLAAGMDRPAVGLLVLAVESGSLFFSHVTDAGFWRVNEYFERSIADALKSWSLMETVISVVRLIGVLV